MERPAKPPWMGKVIEGKAHGTQAEFPPSSDALLHWPEEDGVKRSGLQVEQILIARLPVKLSHNIPYVSK